MNSQQLGAQQSGNVLLTTYIGGVGYFFGPILGAVLITYLQTICPTSPRCGSSISA